jgi:hypothetical protein
MGFERKLVHIDTNEAGYPVYERKQVERGEEENEEPKKMGRRGFLGFLSGAASSVALSGIPALSLLGREEKEEEVAPVIVTPGSVIEDQIELLESFPGSNSRYFQEEVLRYAEWYKKDIDIVLSRALKVAEGDAAGRTMFDYLQEELVVEGIPAAITAELKKYIVGLCNEESRFNPESVSSEGAVSYLQIVPATWEEHAEEEDDIKKLVDQVEAAKSKFSQIYAHYRHTCKDELDAIKAEYFFNDEYLFEAQFLVPFIINAYNAGQGRMEKVLKWFVHAHPMQEKTAGILSDEETISGYDVFFAMAKEAYKTGAVEGYKDKASAYVPKIYGATNMLENYRSEQIDKGILKRPG